VTKQTTKSLRRSLSHQRRTMFGNGKIRKWKAGQNDAAKGEHLSCSLYQISVGVEIGLVCKPVERTPA
jgi:hypothetical protein